MHACGGEIVYLQGAMRDIDSLSSFLFHHSVVGKKFGMVRWIMMVATDDREAWSRTRLHSSLMSTPDSLASLAFHDCNTGSPEMLMSRCAL